MNMPYVECKKCGSYLPKEEKTPEKCCCGNEWTDTDWYTINPIASIPWHKRPESEND